MKIKKRLINMIVLTLVLLSGCVSDNYSGHKVKVFLEENKTRADSKLKEYYSDAEIVSVNEIAESLKPGPRRNC